MERIKVSQHLFMYCCLSECQKFFLVQGELLRLGSFVALYSVWNKYSSWQLERNGEGALSEMDDNFVLKENQRGDYLLQ